jgi:hypothetical protein
MMAWRISSSVGANVVVGASVVGAVVVGVASVVVGSSTVVVLVVVVSATVVVVVVVDGAVDDDVGGAELELGLASSSPEQAASAVAARVTRATRRRGAANEPIAPDYRALASRATGTTPRSVHTRGGVREAHMGMSALCKFGTSRFRPHRFTTTTRT